RRRHTRFSRDWSSDVCSSDLSSAGPGDFFIEVYRPKTEIDSDFLFYEVGEWYPVLHPLSESRDWSRKSWVWKNTLAFSNNGKARSEQRRVGREGRPRRPHDQR